MKIIRSHPPNILDIEAAFPGVSKTPTILYTFGDSVFTTGMGEIPTWIMEHERVHSQRQYELGRSFFKDPISNGTDEAFYEIGAIYWWNRYLQDNEFRLEEELLAHRVELDIFSRFYPDRNTRRAYLKSIAKRLSSGMYGRMVTFEKAKRMIKNV